MIMRCNTSLQSVESNSFDHHSAIYHLLADKFRKHPRSMACKPQSTIQSSPLPILTRSERRSSITTGIGEFDIKNRIFRTAIEFLQNLYQVGGDLAE